MSLICPHCHWPLGVTERDAGSTIICRGCGRATTIPSAGSPDAAILPAAPRGDFPILQTIHSGLLWLGFGLVVVFVIALLLPDRGSRGPSNRATASNNLKHIALAMLNYESAYKCFPPTYTSSPTTGKPLLSWRVHILPYIEEEALYKEFHLDEPWDSPHNRALIPRMPYFYAYPGGAALPEGRTCYLAVVGPQSVLKPPFASSTIAAITDGARNTLLALEVDPSAAVIWTKPDDYYYTQDPQGLARTPGRKGTVAVVYADGHTSYIYDTLSAARFQALCTRDGGELVDPD